MRRYGWLLMAPVIVAVILLSAACGGSDGGKTPAATPNGAIAFSAPAADARVAVPFEVSGDANVFEGVLRVQVLDDAGNAVCERRVQATSGTGTPGTWSTTLAFAPPASDTKLTLKAFDLSPKDGSQENIVTRRVTVAAGLPPIVIETPRCGEQTISQSILTVTGTASVFEGSLLVDVRDAGGAVLQTKTVQTVGAPERGDWQAVFDVSALPAGTYDAVAYSISAKDGSVENAFAVPFEKIL